MGEVVPLLASPGRRRSMRSNVVLAVAFALTSAGGYVARDVVDYFTADLPSAAIAPTTIVAPSVNQRRPEIARSIDVPERAPRRTRTVRVRREAPTPRPVQIVPPAPVSVDLAWVRLDRIAQRSPKRAANLRFALTEALASGSTDKIRALAQRIQVEDRSEP